MDGEIIEWMPDNPIDLGGSSGGGFGFSDAVSGVGSWLTPLLKTWGGVEIAKMQAQNQYYRAPNGMVYREGQPMMGTAISPMMLLLIGGVLLFALKD